jgi:two-component system, chemotaxis family, protein-glutamate methylesterase/glutaminase
MTHNSNENDQKQDSGGFAGTLRNIQITDIIQMCCLAGASLSIRVTQDSDTGTIFIEDGEVVHAECGSLVGVEAFFTILGWPSGQFETMESAAITKPTIKEACQFLLMEAARQADEMALLPREEKVEPEEDLELAPSQRLKVLIVDDSPIMCKILSSMLCADPSIDVVGIAKNGEEALAKMKSLAPDLITMDVNMPVMDGSTALKHIMIGSPCPVLIMSNLLPSSYNTLLSFLNLGAADFMSKPVKTSNIVLQQQRIVERVHNAAKANMNRFQLMRRPKLNPSKFIRIKENTSCNTFVIINSGAGGYLEMVNLVTALPNVSSTGVLSLQSIPPRFAPTLSNFLNSRSRFEVQPFKDKTVLNPGRCYIGTNGKSVQFCMENGLKVLQDKKDIEDSDTQKSMDGILSSAAEVFKDQVLVILLSGGDIGTMDGLRAVKSAGGKILAPQPEKSILPDSFVGAIDEELITELFDSAGVQDILARYCR